jgi:hypothetical protein
VGLAERIKDHPEIRSIALNPLLHQPGAYIFGSHGSGALNLGVKLACRCGRMEN